MLSKWKVSDSKNCFVVLASFLPSKTRINIASKSTTTVFPLSVRISINKVVIADSVNKCACNARETAFPDVDHRILSMSWQRAPLFLILSLNCRCFLRSSSWYEAPLIDTLCQDLDLRLFRLLLAKEADQMSHMDWNIQ